MKTINRYQPLAIGASLLTAFSIATPAKAITVISNIGIPAPSNTDTAPFGATTSINGNSEKAFGFALPSGGSNYRLDNMILWFTGYDGTAANPDEVPVIKITQGGPDLNSGIYPLVATLNPVTTDPINNEPFSNDAFYFEFSGGTPTLVAGNTYYATLSNPSSSTFNWNRSGGGGTVPTENGFTYVGFQFSNDGGGSFSPSSELNGVAINATEITTTAVPFDFSPTTGLLLMGGLWGANEIRKRKVAQNSEVDLSNNN